MAAVGIDVGKTNLDVAVEGRQGITRYANTCSGIAKLVKWLRGLEAPHIVVEAKGGQMAGSWPERLDHKTVAELSRAAKRCRLELLASRPLSFALAG